MVNIKKGWRMKESKVFCKQIPSKFSKPVKNSTVTIVKNQMPVQNAINVKKDFIIPVDNLMRQLLSLDKILAKLHHTVTIISQLLSISSSMRIGKSMNISNFPVFTWNQLFLSEFVMLDVVKKWSPKLKNPWFLHVVEGHFTKNVCNPWLYLMVDTISNALGVEIKRNSPKNQKILAFTFRKKMPIGNLKKMRVFTTLLKWLIYTLNVMFPHVNVPKVLYMISKALGKFTFH